VRPPIQSDDISAFRHTFQSALRNHSGWPPFVYLDNERFRPRPVDGAIEAWIGQDEYGHFEIPSRSDFWRASPRGLFFTRFGFAEDGRFAGVQPGTGFDRTNPTWRVGECLLQIFCVCDALGVSDRDVVLHFKLSGLKGRELISAGNRSRMWSGQKFVSAQDDYVTRQVVQARSIDQNLPELVFGLLKPAYALFDFFDLPRAVVEEELRDMRRHDFGM
jgi:hypothetical protein